MEESEKRKERLKELQLEASQCEYDNNSNSSSPNIFSNPLLETHEANPVESTCTPSTRFDYYTDPMAAFSANKRSKVINHPHNHQPRSPSGVYQEMSSSPTVQFKTNYSPEQTCYQTPGSSQSGAWRSPGTSRYFVSSNLSSGSNPSASGWWSFRGSPTPDSRKGRGQWHGNNTPSPNYGRGQWHGNNTPSPNFGSSGRRGPRSHGHVLAVDRPDRFYKRSMVEDPWESLTPVVFSAETPAVANTSGRKPGAKKAETLVGLDTSGPQQSLAEYLSAALDEASTYPSGD